VQRVRVSPAIAAEVAALPDSFHRDPADRLIVASARVLGATLLTQDAKIIDAKLVPTMS
jgi:PIN domain nuclease of toxin-antitoxin system